MVVMVVVGVYLILLVQNEAVHPYLWFAPLQHLLWIGDIEEIKLGVNRNWGREPHLQVQVQVWVQASVLVVVEKPIPHSPYCPPSVAWWTTP